MTEGTYDPPEERIAALIAKHTPRQLAVAYLRAQHRARDLDLAFKTVVDIGAATEALQNGDLDAVDAKLERTLRRLNDAKERQS